MRRSLKVKKMFEENDDGGLEWFQTVGQYEGEVRGMIVKNSGGDFEQAPIGTHMARCIRLIDIGTQENEYQGKKTSRRQVILGFEIPDELMTKGESAGKPFIISKFYTASIGEKANLRHDLVSWRGREFTETELDGFNLANILDKPCMISVTKNDKERSVISTIAGLPKGVTVGARLNPIVNFSLDEYDEKTFLSLGQKMQEMIARSPEYKALKSKAEPIFDDFNDTIPF